MEVRSPYQNYRNSRTEKVPQRMTRHKQIWLSTSCEQTEKNSYMNWKFFLIGCSYFAIAQSITWFTSNLQLMYPYFKTLKGIAWLVLLAMPASVGYMMATKYLYTAMDNSLWSVRLIGFSMGVFSFTILTYLFMNEGLNVKNSITLALSVIIVLLQVFWK